jgi:hypothetical protein
MLASTVMFRVAPAAAGSFQYETLSVTGQKSSYATGINDRDQVAGGFDDASGQSHGFVWDKGAFTQVDGSGATYTELGSINARGLAAGYYLPAGGSAISFTYDTKTGQQQMLKINPKYGFYEEGINSSGVMVGFAEGGKNDFHGFDGKTNGKNVKLLTVPGGTIETLAFGINDSGVVVGSYLDSAAIYHGYMYQAGAYVSFDPPGSTATAAASITDDGIVCGNYTDASGQTHGFTMSGGAFTVYDYPEAASSVVVGVGPGGEVVGNWTDSTNTQHGFVNLGGSYYTIDKPGGSATTIAAVSSKGSLVGYFTEGQERGFIARCPTGQSPCTQ